MNIFFDTSALIKLYHKETGSLELVDFLENNSKDLILIISDITPTEFHSAFMRRVRMKDISESVAFSIFKALDRDIIYYYKISVDTIVKDMATKLIDSISKYQGLRTLDAFQLAAALYCDQFIHVDQFISSDEKLIKVAAHYFPVVNPEELLSNS